MIWQKMRKLLVIIVEPNNYFAEALKMLVQREGYVVVGMTDSATAALALASDVQPDFAIVDLALKDGMTGPELGQTLARQGINVLFLTAAPEFAPKPEDRIMVLTKPAGDKAIMGAVRSILPR